MRFLKYLLLHDADYRRHVLLFNAFNMMGVFWAVSAAYVGSGNFPLQLVLAALTLIYVQFWTQLRSTIDRPDFMEDRVDWHRPFADTPLGRLAQLQRHLRRSAAMSRVIVRRADCMAESLKSEGQAHLRTRFSDDDYLLMHWEVNDRNAGWDEITFHLARAGLAEGWHRILQNKPVKEPDNDSVTEPIKAWSCCERQHSAKMFPKGGKQGLLFVRKDLIRHLNSTGNEGSFPMFNVNVDVVGGTIRMAKGKGRELVKWLDRGYKFDMMRYMHTR